MHLFGYSSENPLQSCELAPAAEARRLRVVAAGGRLLVLERPEVALLTVGPGGCGGRGRAQVVGKTLIEDRAERGERNGGEALGWLGHAHACPRPALTFLMYLLDLNVPLVHCEQSGGEEI